MVVLLNNFIMARTKLAQRRITTLLNKPEELIIEQAEEKGYNISEIIREQIRRWGAENFPPMKPYNKLAEIKAKVLEKKIEDQEDFENLSEQDYAEKVLRGQVRDGGKVAFRMVNGREWYMPLKGIKEKTADDEAIVLHNKLLDRTAEWFGGKPLTEADYRESLDGWAERQPAWDQRRELGLPDLSKKATDSPVAEVDPETEPMGELDGEDLVDISTEE
jgi:hypothetical protein